MILIPIKTALLKKKKLLDVLQKNMGNACLQNETNKTLHNHHKHTRVVVGRYSDNLQDTFKRNPSSNSKFNFWSKFCRLIKCERRRRIRCLRYSDNKQTSPRKEIWVAVLRQHFNFAKRGQSYICRNSFVKFNSILRSKSTAKVAKYFTFSDSTQQSLFVSLVLGGQNSAGRFS